MLPGILLGGLFVGSVPAPLSAAPKPTDVKEVVDKAIGFLKTKQTADGGFAPKLGGPGVSSLVAAGLIRNGRGDEELVTKTLGFIEKSVKGDGGIYDKGLSNYTTSVALVAFKDANKGGKYDKIIENASKYLKSLQNVDNEKELRYGGVGYDAKSAKPDLSNETFFVEALLAAGVPKDDPAIKKALVFISRCQNSASEEQDQAFAKKTSKGDEGGFVYNPADATNLKSDRRTSDGGLRSEGGMTYSGLKSFLYAGVGKDDARVKAAVKWVREHYTLDENPGMGQSGLYYYYHTFAKAMDAYGEDEFADASGKKHDWRSELFEALKKRQKANGSWVNETAGFGENVPELSTAYAILALSYCSPKK
jgi:squalene-hopene/tetraprenyl-beta-curcumene cyclase